MKLRKKPTASNLQSPMTNGIVFSLTLFVLCSFCLLSMKNGAVDYAALIFSLILVGMVLFQYILFRFAFVRADLQIMLIVNILSMLGMVVQYRLDPATAYRQFIFYAAGIVLMILIMIILPKMKKLRSLDLFFACAAIALLCLATFFGTESGGSRNWFSIGSFTFQPSEPVKVLLVLILAGELSKNRNIRKIIPTGIFVGISMILLVLQKDLGATLLYFGAALIMLYLGTGNIPITLAAFGAGAGGAVVSYHLFYHVRTRVAVWRDPWADPLGSGYQIVQSLIAIASGGLFGMGLGNGVAKGLLPQYDTDFVFAVICEEFGQIIGVCVLLFYFVLVFRGCIIALRAKTRFEALLCVGSVAMLALQTITNIGGVIRFIPLTGVTLPFISYGGSSMITSMIFIGIVQAISIANGGRRR
ncbi:MAG: FtsW/RodA/SpoVE family cell cycle protein [Clostridia bacterium]|nr:FtsW/RodA/SpoVE family cell cycle protein [Clostridia bacterium]